MRRDGIQRRETIMPPYHMGIDPAAMAPRPRSFFTGNRVPYTGEQLREIRKRKGVGRPPAIMYGRLAAMGCTTEPHGRIVIGLARLVSPLSDMETPDYSEWNLAEWERKPRRKDRKAA